jgi:hypothetical protein
MSLHEAVIRAGGCAFACCWGLRTALSRLFLHPLDHRYQLLLVVGLLGQGLTDDQLQRGAACAL